MTRISNLTLRPEVGPLLRTEDPDARENNDRQYCSNSGFKSASGTTRRKMARPARRFWPEVPYKVEDLGIPAVVRGGPDSAAPLRRRHGDTGIAQQHARSFPGRWWRRVFHQLRQQQLLDVKGMIGNDYTFTLTNNGRAMAAERVADLQLCRAGAGLDSGISPVHAGAVGQGQGEPRFAAAGLRRPGGDRRHAGPARAVADLAEIGVPLRAHRATARPAWRSECCASIRTAS